MKLVVTFLLSLLFLLVRGNNHLYAHAHHNRICFSPAQLPQKSKGPNFSLAKHSQNTVGKTSSSNSESDGINATELEDEDDYTSSRKFVEITNYFLSFFYNQIAGDSSLHQKDPLPFCKHFSYSSSYKYLIQRVIRI